MTQGVERESLSQYRGGLESLLVGRRQAIDPRQNQALNCGWNLLSRTLFEISQQVLQEQRIAGRAFHTALRQLAGRADKTARQQECILLTQRTQVDRNQRASPDDGAPFLV